MNRDGQALLTIGTRGEAGEWNEASGSRKLNQPNDVVIADSGDIFVVQGTPRPSGDARASSSARMARSSNRGAVKELVRSVPGRARHRYRRQGSAVGCGSGESTYPGLPAGRNVRQGNQIQGAAVRPRHRPAADIYMVNGFAGQLVRMDLNGKVLAALGKPGKGPGEFGEAHMIAVNDRDEIYVADSVNAALLKFVKK